jgi:hypothetical protein
MLFGKSSNSYSENHRDYFLIKNEPVFKPDIKKTSDKLQKSEGLTTFSRSDCHQYIFLYFKDLTPAGVSQKTPAKSGQGEGNLHCGTG